MTITKLERSILEACCIEPKDQIQIMRMFPEGVSTSFRIETVGRLLRDGLLVLRHYSNPKDPIHIDYSERRYKTTESGHQVIVESYWSKPVGAPQAASPPDAKAQPHTFQWNGSMWNDPKAATLRDMSSKLHEQVERMARESYNRGIEDGLNIEENQLAQEVKRLRDVMKRVATTISVTELGQTGQGRAIVEALMNGGFTPYEPTPS